MIKESKIEGYQNPNREMEPKEVGYKEVVECMRSTNKAIEPLLREAVSSVDDESSRKKINYFFEPRYNKPKVRPLVTRLAFDVASEFLVSHDPSLKDSSLVKFDVIKKLCTAIRLMDGATLIHDDALDHTAQRDGQPSIYKKWGYEPALISGEVLRELSNKFFSQAIEDQEAACDKLVSSGFKYPTKKTISPRTMIFKSPQKNGADLERSVDIQRKVFDLFNNIWFKIYIGQLFDNEEFSKEKQPTREQNERRLYYLTGAFMERSMTLGTFWSGLREEDGKQIFEKLASYGKYYGMATQLRNDLYDFAPSEGFGEGTALARGLSYDDFKDGKQTLPVILAREMCSTEEWALIFQKLGNDISDEEKLKINEILANRGIIKIVQKQIFEYSKKAIQALEEIPFNCRQKEMLRTWALAVNSSINVNFAGGRPSNIKLDSLKDMENFF